MWSLKTGGQSINLKVKPLQELQDLSPLCNGCQILSKGRDKDRVMMECFRCAFSLSAAYDQNFALTADRLGFISKL